MTLEQPVDPLGPREPRRLGFRLEIGGIVQPALGLGQLEQRLVEPAQLLRVRLVEGDQVGECLWPVLCGQAPERSEEHTSELQSLMRISYAVFCLKKKISCHKRKCRTSRNSRQ